MTASIPVPAFIPGLELSRRFFEEVAQPILARQFPRLTYAAGLIGPGSEVIGFDTPISSDHHWGPRVMLFLREADFSDSEVAIDQLLSQQLPVTFLGYSTNFGTQDAIGVRLMQPITDGPVAHRVEIMTVRSWFTGYLGWNPQQPPTIIDWLTFPEHRLRAATAGSVFHDDVGELTSAREKLNWYPDDVWLYLLAAQWNRIAEEEAFMARCGDVGDELGSVLIAARLVKVLMRLCFLMERQYPPYAKWFGTAFRQLSCAAKLEPALRNALNLQTWQERQQALSNAYQNLVAAHNALQITSPLDPHVRLFHNRPYRVLDAARIASAIEALINDPDVLRLPGRLGSLSQLLDSSDVLEAADKRERLRRLYV